MKSHSKHLVLIFLALILALSILTGTTYAAKAPKLSKTLVSIELGKTTSLKVSNATSTVVWSSSDESIATVSGGTVTAKGVGSAVITASCGSTNLTCKVNVYGAEFTPKELTLSVGESQTINATLLGSAVTFKSASSSNTRVATVTKAGVVKGINPGTATLTIKINKGEYQIPVTVVREAEIEWERLYGENWYEFQNELLEELNTSMLSSKYEFKDIQAVYDVKLVDQDGNEVQTQKMTQVEIDDTEMDEPNNMRLFRIHNNKVNEIQYTLDDGILSFETDMFSTFVLANVKSTKAVPASLEVFPYKEDILTVYTETLLFTSRDFYPCYDEYNVFVVYSDGYRERVYHNLSTNITHAPKEAGPFDVVLSWTAPNGTVLSDTIHMTAIDAEPIIDPYLFGQAAGYAGNVNGKSLKKVIFTDMAVPTEGTARIDGIGKGKRSVVMAWRMLGEEDILYVSANNPGTKPIYEGGSLFVGYVHEIDARGLDTSRATRLPYFSANGGAFQNGVKKINYSGCDFHNVTNMNIAFNSYTALQELDMSYCDFSNVETFNSAFIATPNLKKVDFTGSIWGKDKLYDVDCLFADSGIESIDLSMWNTSAITDTSAMFMRCKNLQYADLSGLDMSNVTDAAYMFQECNNLETLILNENGMPNLEGSIRQMFDCCYKLHNVDLSGMNFSNITNVFRAFYNCKELKTTLNIDATNFDTSYGYTFADMAIGDTADVTVNCTQASKEILDDHMIWSPSGKTIHVTYNITDADPG